MWKNLNITGDFTLILINGDFFIPTSIVSGFNIDYLNMLKSRLFQEPNVHSQAIFFVVGHNLQKKKTAC